MTGGQEHNAYAYSNGRCKCDVCAGQHRQRLADQRRQWRSARVLLDGRLVAPLPAERHGMDSTYTNHGCRCLRCTAAHTAKERQRRAAA